MKKKFVSYYYCLLQSALLLFMIASCSSPENKAPEGAYASSSSNTTEVTPAPEETTKEEEAYRPLLWEIKWSSRRVLDFGKNYEKVCKTEFTNPYKKIIRSIKIGYEVKTNEDAEVARFEKIVELNLKPGQSKVVDMGVGCNDFFMFKVVFADGSSI